MAKNTSKKIKELKGVKPEKINEEELNKVQSVINNINRVNIEVGRIESQKHRLLHDSVALQQELQSMQDEFEKDYGSVNINIEDGTIKYPENGEANKKD